MNMLLSIIIPAYNCEKTLDRCVSSIIPLLGEDVELLLVDDGSTDSTPDMCDVYAGTNDRIRVIHQCNSGVSAARNAGLDRAEGEWVTFVDSDDEVVVSGMANAIRCLRITDKDMVLENVRVSWESGLSKPILPERIYSLSDMYDAELCGAVWNKTYRKRMLDALPLRFDESLKFYEDWLFVAKYCSAVKEFDYVPDVCYIQHLPQSYSKKYEKYLGFNYRINVFPKIDSVNKDVSRRMVDGLVMSFFAEAADNDAFERKLRALFDEVGTDIRYASGLRKAPIRMLGHFHRFRVWKIVFKLYIRLGIC